MLKKFINYYKPHKKLFIIDLICSFTFAVLSLAYPFLARIIIDKYIPSQEHALPDNAFSMILIISGILLAVYVFRALLSYVINYWGHIFGIRMQADMRRDLFDHLQMLPFKYYDENKTGSIMSRMTSDLFEVAELSHHMPEDAFISIITIVGALVMLFSYNVYLALIILAILPFMIIFAMSRRKKLKAAFKDSREKIAEINACIESSISGIRVTKAYTAMKLESEKFDIDNTNFKRARSNAHKNMSILNSGLGLFNNLLYLAAICSGALFCLYGQISTGEFAAFMLFIGIMISPISTFVTLFEQIQDGMTGFARFQEIMAVPAETDPENPLAVDTLLGDIAFNDVSFSYKSREKDGATKVIKNLSLRIEKGKTVAFAGPSGGGKTTLCHLIPRFYEIDGGTITIDGNDISLLKLDFLRKNVGIVAQDVFLFNGTIKENIAYGNTSASIEEIIESAKKANIHDFIDSLPQKYDSQVGERGVKLSGGQKQRISIARAFLKNPPILILDEATSSLDNVSEMLIQSSLEELSKGRTTIVVAHRLSTIKNSDEIFILTQDGIAEHGSHDDLIKQNGIYAHLYSFYGE